MSLKYVGQIMHVHIWSDSEMLNDEPPRFWRSMQSSNRGEYDVSVSIGGARELFARFYPHRARMTHDGFMEQLRTLRNPFDYSYRPTPEQARVGDIAQRREVQAEVHRQQEFERLRILNDENVRLRHMIDLQRDELQRLQEQDRVPEPPPDDPLEEPEPGGRRIVL